MNKDTQNGNFLLTDPSALAEFAINLDALLTFALPPPHIRLSQSIRIRHASLQKTTPRASLSIIPFCVKLPGLSRGFSCLSSLLYLSLDPLLGFLFQARRGVR